MAASSDRRSLRRRDRPFAPIMVDGVLPDLPSAPVPSWRLNGIMRTTLRFGVFLLLTLSLVPAQMLALVSTRRLAIAIPFFYHRLVCRILGMKVVVHGERQRGGSVLYVANHCSWADIPIFSSVLPASFIAKSEVASWPLFGQLAKLQRTIFVSREKRARTGDARDEIVARLGLGDNLILFPEGTSSDGNRVLPFKSALFGAAEALLPGPDGVLEPIVVQPVTISYTRLDGMPMGRDYRPFFTWYGDMDLAPHLLRALSFGSVTAEVEFHPALTVTAAGGRKRLAQQCELAVRAGHERALRGRRS